MLAVFTVRLAGGLPVPTVGIAIAGIIVAVVVVIAALWLFRSGGKKKAAQNAALGGTSDWQRQAQPGGAGTPAAWNSQMPGDAAGNWGQQVPQSGAWNMPNGAQQPANAWGAQSSAQQQPSWGGTQGAAQQQPVNAWGAQSSAQQQPSWGGTQGAAQQQSSWGAQSSAQQQPSWGGTQGAAQQQPSWGAQSSAQQQPSWGGTQGAAQQQPSWGAQSSAQQQPSPMSWGATQSAGASQPSVAPWGSSGTQSSWEPTPSPAPTAQDPWNQQSAAPWGNTPSQQQGSQAPTAYSGSSAPAWGGSPSLGGQAADAWNPGGLQPQYPGQGASAAGMPMSSWQQGNFGAGDGDKTMLRPQSGGQGIIRVEEGKEPGRIYDIRKDSLSIGRSRESDIFLEDLAVSRLHASIVNMGNGNYALKDEGSANGTKVNGQLVNKYQTYPLQEGDRIQLGQTVLIFARK